MLFKVGNVLTFDEKDKTIIVVMANEEGVRYIDPKHLEFNDDCSVRTQFVSNETLMFWAKGSKIGDATIKHLISK